MKIDIEHELQWMRNFKTASSLTPEQFEALLVEQRRLFETLMPTMVVDRRSGAYSAPGYRTCDDCGAMTPECDGCPLCATVNRDRLPPMAFGIVFDSPEQFAAWKATAL